MNFRRIRRTRDGVLNSDGHAVGLDLGATAVRATVLEPRMLGGRPSATIVDVGKVDLPPGVVVNGVVQEPGPLTAALKQLWHMHKLSSHQVILGIANQQVLVRQMTIPDLDPQQRAKALPFQAREVVALPIDQVVLDFCQLGTADPETNLVPGLLLATPREPVLVAVRAVERAGLTVARVDLSSFGSLRSIADEDPAVEAVIDIGAHLTTVVIHQNGVPKLVRTLARGGHQLTEQLSDRMSINEMEAETAKCDVGLDGERSELTRMLAEALRPLVAEIRTSVQYFRSSNAGQQIAQMSLTGGGAALRGVAALMEEQIGLPTRVGDPTQHLGNRESSEHLREGGSLSELSAVSVGLAMGAAA
jgi:type IV pilus assembly protein PilM